MPYNGRCGKIRTDGCESNCGMCYGSTRFTPAKELKSGYMGYSIEWLERHAAGCGVSVEQYIAYWESSGLAMDVHSEGMPNPYGIVD